MQRSISGSCIHTDILFYICYRNKTYSVASAPTVTGPDFMRSYSYCTDYFWYSGHTWHNTLQRCCYKRLYSKFNSGTFPVFVKNSCKHHLTPAPLANCKRKAEASLKSWIVQLLCTAVHVILAFSASFSLPCFLFLFNDIPKSERDSKKYWNS